MADDVDQMGNCSHCGGVHFGTGASCPFREENMGEPCVVCGERTNYCCSDCAIDRTGRVYVCTEDACRTEHEKKHAKPSETKAEEIARLRREIGERQTRLQFLVLGDPRVGFHIGPEPESVS